MHAENHSFGIVCESREFREVLKLAERLADHKTSVLIHGETGTGKELLARVLHYSGARSDWPFVPVNAGAMVDSLVENELFGHAAGAFTDARGRSRGLVDLAAGGTLFLDEIDALGPHGQATLLRFLEDGRYRPIGSPRELSSDVRVIAATNGDPKLMVEAGSIRKDLYFRLAGVMLHVPPLRNRPEDILPLARHFLDGFNAQERDHQDRSLGPEMIGWLLSQPWPGNVRELRSAIEYAFIMSDEGVLLPPAQAAADTIPALGCFRSEKAGAINCFERNYLERAMREAEGNVSLAARTAGKERKGFDRLLKKHGIERANFRSERSQA